MNGERTERKNVILNIKIYAAKIIGICYIFHVIRFRLKVMKLILWPYIKINVKIYIELDIVHKSIQTLYCTGDRDQDHPQEKEMQKSNMAV